MASAERLLAFEAMSFLLIGIPGPSVLFVIGRALAQRAALTTVVGTTLGAYVLICLDGAEARRRRLSGVPGCQGVAPTRLSAGTP